MCQEIVTQFKCGHASSVYPAVEMRCAQFKSTMARAKENNQPVQACPNYAIVADRKDSYCPECQAAGRGP